MLADLEGRVLLADFEAQARRAAKAESERDELRARLMTAGVELAGLKLEIAQAQAEHPTGVCLERGLKSERDKLRRDLDRKDHEVAELRAEVDRLRALPTKGWREEAQAQQARAEKAEVALRIIAGEVQCVDNLMSNVEIACAALRDTAEPRTILDESASVPPEMWNLLRDKGQP